MSCPPAFQQTLCLRRLAQAGACPPGLTGDSVRPALAVGSHTYTWAVVLPISPSHASSQQPAASSQQPAASSQQPAASSQQPAASSQQPAASSQQPGASSQ